MKKPKFQIGDDVWVAGYDQSDKQVECPDCMGAKSVKVTLKDGTEYSLACSGCAPGFDLPRGWVTRYERKATAWSGTVQAVELRSDVDEQKFNYRTHNRSADEDDVFATRDEAVTRAADVIRRQEEEDKRYRIHEKERVNHKWSWHVHYHRRQIRDAKQTIERATAQLNVAREKAKEAK